MFRFVPRVSGLLVLLVVLFAQAGLESIAQNITTCADFVYQEDAQKVFDQGGGRPQDWYDGMDRDGDGIACESLPGRPVHKEGWFWPAIGGLGIVAFGGGGFLWSRKSGSKNAGAFTATPTTGPYGETVVQEVEDVSTVKNESESQLIPTPSITINVPVTVENRAESQSDATASARAASSSHSESECVWEPEGQVFKGSVYNGVNLDVERDPAVLRRLPYWVYLRTRYWRDIANTAKKRAKFTCESKGCGVKRNLHVHHLTYDRGNEKPEHLQVLCAPCHRRVHNKP